MTGLDRSHVPETLEGGVRRHPDGGRLLERHIRRFPDESNVANCDVLRQGPDAHAEDFVSEPKLCHVFADRFDASRKVPTEDAVHGPALAEPDQADDIRPTSHHVHVPQVEGGRGDANQHLIVADGRLLDLLKFEHIG